MKRAFATVICFCLISSCATSGFQAAKSGIVPKAFKESKEIESKAFVTLGKKGMVVCDDKKAGEWGVEILKKGGNAMDAAVATAFALAVSRPHFASIGGGGFLLYCPAGKSCTLIDYREQAPFKAYPDMFLNKTGQPNAQLDGAKAIGVPGVVSGLARAHVMFGRKKFSDLLTRPIEWAEKGIPVSPYMEDVLAERWPASNDGFKKVFGCQGQPCKKGSLIRQKDLALTLQRIRNLGGVGFYGGVTADKISAEIQKAGGLISREDLNQYQAAIRQPLIGRFAGFEVITTPPPSSGGVILLQLLHHFERGRTSMHERLHAMNMSFWDRARYLGDPDFVKVPLAELLDEKMLDERWNETYREDRFNNLEQGAPLHRSSSDNTTHFSVVDREGNAASITTTLNGDFGSAFLAEGTGVVMNNQMDDFTSDVGALNQFGLTGSRANLIRPKKRPLSTMSPTILRDDKGETRFILGAQGGPRIPTGVYQVLVNRIVQGMSLPDAVEEPRFHSQWRPEAVRIEKQLVAKDLQVALRRLGYTVEEIPSVGKVQAIERARDGTVIGAADRRAEGVPVAEE